MIYPNRNYGNIDHKDQGSSVFLFPDEQPRTPYPFPSDFTCPHCGRRNGNIRTERFFRCWTCGTTLQMPMPVMPITDDMLAVDKAGGSLVNAVCEHCGRPFVKKASNRSPHCQRCRSNIQSTDWREKHPEQYRATQARHQGLIKAKQARLRELKKEFL